MECSSCGSKKLCTPRADGAGVLLREVVFEKRAIKLDFEAGQVQGKGQVQGAQVPPRRLYAPVLWAGRALPIEPNLIITIDADLPTPQTPPSPPILMCGGMERPVWCFHPQGLG